MIDGKLLYPIGSIYMSIQDTNPSVFFGGTWERIAKGKTLVGVDESDSDFNASSKTGGEKEHTLTIDEIPSHSHKTFGQYAKIGSGSIENTWLGWSSGNAAVMTTGGSQPHNILQPFYTCYIFVRTA